MVIFFKNLLIFISGILWWVHLPEELSLIWNRHFQFPVVSFYVINEQMNIINR